MVLESAKCPNCAVDIQVPNDREDAFCTYCGSTVKTKAAIGYFQVELKGKVQIDTDPTVQAKIQRGRETGELKYFYEVLDIDPYCNEARLAISNAADVHDPSRNLFVRMRYLDDFRWNYRFNIPKGIGQFDYLYQYVFGRQSYENANLFQLSSDNQLQIIINSAKAALTFFRKEQNPMRSIINVFCQIKHLFECALNEGILTGDKIEFLKRMIIAFNKECIDQEIFVLRDSKKSSKNQVKSYTDAMDWIKQHWFV